MSIINEALKKASREKESIPSSSYQENLQQKLESELQKKKSRITWAPVFIILVLLLVAGPIVAPLFSTSFKKPSLQPSPTTKPSSNNVSNRKSQFGIEELPLFQGGPGLLAPKPQFKLTGIVYSPEDSYCIINNRILKVGDSVQGARLISVTPDGAMLDYNGNKISLST